MGVVVFFADNPLLWVNRARKKIGCLNYLFTQYRLNVKCRFELS